MTSRRVAREQALQALYSIVIGDREPRDAVSEVLGERRRQRATSLCRGACAGYARIRRTRRSHREPALGRLGDRTSAYHRSPAPRNGYIRTSLPSRDAKGGRDQRGGRPREAFLHRGIRTFRQWGSERRRQCQVVSAPRRRPYLAGNAGRVGDDGPLRDWSRGRHGCCVRTKPSGYQPNGRLPAGELDSNLCARRNAARIGLQGKSGMGPAFAGSGRRS